MNDFEEIKSRVVLADLIHEETGLALKKAGSNTLGLHECPFCGGHDCFRIQIKNQFYKCFQCDEGGDVFSFIKKRHEFNSRFEALKYVSKKIGCELKNKKECEGYLRTQEAKRHSAEYYSHNLLERLKSRSIRYAGGQDDKVFVSTVLEYQTVVRKHDPSVLRKLKIGYADGGLFDYLIGKGFKKQEIQKSGLLNSAGKDLFKDTYVYPQYVDGEMSHFTQKDPLKKQKHQVKKEYWDKRWFGFNQDSLDGKEVILCEGENDVLSVVGKGGASAAIAFIGSISNEQLEALAPHIKGKIAYTCFDSDDTGKKYEKLVSGRYIGDEYDIRLVNFEGAKDIDEILKASQDPKTLLASLISNAVKPPEITSPIEIRNGRYFVQRRRGSVQITNFTIRIKNRIVSNGNSVREVAFVDINGEETRPFILEPEHMVTPSRFKEFCLSKGNFVFEGNGTDLAEIWKYEMAKDRGRKIIQPDHIGFLQEFQLWLFGNALFKDGKVITSDDDGVFWIGNTGFKPVSLSIKDEDQAVLPELRIEEPEKSRELLRFIVQKSKENIGNHNSSLALGYIKAVIYSREIFNRFKFFPFLFIYGKFQCGKNTFARFLLWFFGLGDTDGISITEATQTGISRKLAYLSCLLVWLDEFRNEVKTFRLSSFLRSVYNKITSVKGIKSDFGTRNVPVRAALLLSGEQLPSDPGLRSRCIPIMLRRNQRKDSVLHEINNVAYRLSAITSMWILEKTPEKVSEFLENIETIKTQLQADHQFDTRLAENYAVPIAGFRSIASSEEFDEFYEWVVEAAKHDKEAKDEDHVLHQFLEDIEVLICNRAVPSDYFQVDDAAGEVKFYFNGLYNMWARDFRQRKGEEPFPKRAILDHFREEDYYIKYDRPYINGRQFHGLVLDLKKAPADLVSAMRNHPSR